MDAGQPCLEICEDEMDDGQKPYSQTNTTPGGCMRQPDKHASLDQPLCRLSRILCSYSIPRELVAPASSFPLYLQPIRSDLCTPPPNHRGSQPCALVPQRQPTQLSGKLPLQTQYALCSEFPSNKLFPRIRDLFLVRKIVRSIRHYLQKNIYLLRATPKYHLLEDHTLPLPDRRLDIPARPLGTY